MSVATVDIGKLVHTFPERSLKLSSTCSIRLAYPPDFLFPTASPITGLIPAGGLWIARGNGLQLSLSVELDGISMDDSRRRELIEDLGTVLKTAEIWSQLFLQTSLSVPARRVDDLDDSPDLLLALKHDPQLCWNSKHATKAPILIVSDTRPPINVPSAGLEEVRISLVFSRTSQIRSKRAKCKTPDQTGEISEDEVMLFGDSDLEPAESPHHPQPTPFFLSQNPPDDSYHTTSSSQASLGSSDEMLDGQLDVSFSTDDYPCYLDQACQSQQFLSSQQITPMYAQEPESLSSQFPEADPDEMLNDEYSDSVPNNFPRSTSEILTGRLDNTFFLPKSTFVHTHPANARKRSISPSPLVLPALDITTAAKLLDAALRTLIWDTKPRLSAGIKVSDISPGPKLAEISPALFSPGYLHAVCQRNRFLPRISHSIASVQRRAKSAVPGSKVKELFSSSHLSSRAEAIPSVTTNRPPQTLTTTIQARLWTLIQRRLFDPRAARKLKRLQIPSTGLDRASDKMLDDGYPSSPAEPLDGGSTFNDGEEMLDDHTDNDEDKDELLFADDEDEEDELLFSDYGDQLLGCDISRDDDNELLDNPAMGDAMYIDADDQESADGDIMLDM